MFNKVSATHVKIVNLWLVSILIMIWASNFAHWPTVETITWINCALFFFLFLQSLFILHKEISHQSLFINVAVWTFLSSIQILNIFIGPGYALGGSEKLAFTILDFRRIIMPFLASYVIIHVVMSVSFREAKPWISTVTSFLLTGCIAAYLYRAVLFYSPSFDPSTLIASQTFKLLLLPLTALIGYWVYHFRHDPPISEHIKVLLGFFFVYLVIELTDLFTMLYGIKLYSVSQVVLLSVLLFLMVTFFNRTNYIFSEFGQYYEKLLKNGNPLDVPIIRKESHSLQPIASFLHTYFVEKPVYGALSILCLVFSMSYLRLPTSAMANVAAIAIAFLLLFVYWRGLSRKRDLANNIIKFR